MQVAPSSSPRRRRGRVVLAAVTTRWAALTVLLREGLRRGGSPTSSSAQSAASPPSSAPGRRARARLRRARLVGAAARRRVRAAGLGQPPDAGAGQPTGCPSKEGFDRLLDAGVGRLRRGRHARRHAAGHRPRRVQARSTTRTCHDVGDEVLAEVGAACRPRPAADDIAGRLGGDEFALYLPGLDGPGRRRPTGRRGRRRPAEPIATTAGTVTIGASIGRGRGGGVGRGSVGRDACCARRTRRCSAPSGRRRRPPLRPGEAP